MQDKPLDHLPPLPLLAVEGKRFGANFTVVPKYGDRLHGAVAIQLKLKVW